MANINKVKDLESKLKKLEEDAQSFRNSVRQESEALFTSNGGCERCDGRGWIVVWDTLDCTMGSYAQYGSCTNDLCTRETRSKSGLKPRNAKHDRWNSNSTWRPNYTKSQILEVATRDNEIRDLKALIVNENKKWGVSKDKICKVVRVMKGPKARRVPVGTEGLVQKVWTNSWGSKKVIILDEEGNQYWASFSSVDVTNPDPDLTEWRKRDEAGRQESGFPVIVTIKATSRKAALIKTTTGPEFWVPFSQAPELSKAKKGQTLSVFLPMWLAKKNSLTTG